MSTNTSRTVAGQGKHCGHQINRRVCYVRRIGGRYPCHRLSDGRDRSAGDSGEDHQPADIVQAGESGRKHAEEYTPTDKARAGKI